MTGEDIDFVSKLTEEAGYLALSMRDRLEISEKTSPEDQVTSADLAISRLFKEGLQSRFQDDAVISEEDLDHALNHERKRISGNTIISLTRFFRWSRSYNSALLRRSIKWIAVLYRWDLSSPVL